MRRRPAGFHQVRQQHHQPEHRARHRQIRRRRYHRAGKLAQQQYDHSANQHRTHSPLTATHPIVRLIAKTRRYSITSVHIKYLLNPRNRCPNASGMPP